MISKIHLISLRLKANYFPLLSSDQQIFHHKFTNYVSYFGGLGRVDINDKVTK